MINFKNISLSLIGLLVAGSFTIAADLNRSNDNSEKLASSWKSLANEAASLIDAGDLELASDLLNESIRTKKTVRNLTLKGDQYAKDNMQENALYFYQKALVEGITNERKFDVTPLQLKIMELDPSVAYLNAKGDVYIGIREFKGGTEMYIKALNKALKVKDADLITQIQDKVRRIN